MQFWSDEPYKPASWMIVDANGKAILETYNQKLAELTQAPYRAIPILDYLSVINRRVAKGLTALYIEN